MVLIENLKMVVLCFICSHLVVNLGEKTTGNQIIAVLPVTRISRSRVSKWRMLEVGWKSLER